MGPTELVLEALSYIRPSNSAGDQATLTLSGVRQKQTLADTLTAILQDIYRDAPQFYRRPIGGALPAPAQITVAVTAGSDTFTTSDSFPDGCTIVVDGDTTFNQARTENGTKKLLTPYLGTSGSRSATVYGDCVALASNIEGVIGNAYVGGLKVAKAANKADLYAYTGAAGAYYQDYGRRIKGLNRNTPRSGQPVKYWVETALLVGTTGHESRLWMRFNPMPTAQVALTYDVTLRAPKFSIADLGSDDTPSTKSLVIPGDAVESLLRPLFLLRWASSPWFKDPEAKKSLEEQAKPALDAMERYRALIPGPRNATPKV